MDGFRSRNERYNNHSSVIKPKILAQLISGANYQMENFS